MKKRGFTLIELLAVIVILAIIALIATPAVLNIIEDSRKSAAEASARNIVNAAKTYYMSETMNGRTVGSIDLSGDTLKYDGDQADKGYISFTDGKPEAKMYISGYCVEVAVDGKVTSEKKAEDECEIEIEVACDGFVSQVISSYKINKDNCQTYAIEMQSLSAEEAVDFCNGDSKLQNVYYVNDLFDILIETGQAKALMDYNVLYDIVYEEKCQSCYDLAGPILSFDINEEVCKTMFASTNMSAEEVELYCKGDVSIGTQESLNVSIKKNPFILEKTGLIQNVTYDDSEIYIAGFKCGIGNANGLPEIRDLVIPEKMNGKPVKKILSASFAESNLNSIKIPNSIISIKEAAFEMNENLTLVEIDNVEGAIPGTYKDWGLSNNVTVTWLRSE